MPPHDAGFGMVARGIVRRFRGRHGVVTALGGVDLAVGKGETVALVGASGSGKSTLVRILLRLERPDAGEVRFDGVDPYALDRSALRAFRRRVQAVFQDPFASLDPRWTVGRSVREPLDVHGIGDAPGRAAIVKERLTEVGLPSSYASRYPHELSGGERQRVAIARALALDPELLVADEPASSLDAPIRRRIVELLAERRRSRGLAVLVVAHDFGTVRKLADRVVVLDAGRVVETGPTPDVLAAPTHPVTAELVRAAGTLSGGLRPNRPSRPAPSSSFWNFSSDGA